MPGLWRKKVAERDSGSAAFMSSQLDGGLIQSIVPLQSYLVSLTDPTTSTLQSLPKETAAIGERMSS